VKTIFFEKRPFWENVQLFENFRLFSSEKIVLGSLLLPLNVNQRSNELKWLVRIFSKRVLLEKHIGDIMYENPGGATALLAPICRRP